MEKIVTIHPAIPDPRLMKKAGDLIQDNGLVVFPTQGLYGLAANALSPQAVEKIFSAKQRPRSNPLLILIHELQQLDVLITHIPEQAKRLIRDFWPGALTLVFQANKTLPKQLLGNTDKIGIRMPAHPVALALAKAANVPITGTSANISGTPPCPDIKHLSRKLIPKTDMILNAGPLAGGPGSTVVDVTCTPPKIIRQGSISTPSIFQALGKMA